MRTHIDVDIVSSSLEGAADSSSDDGPGKLMKGDQRTKLSAENYPEVTTHVNIEPASGTVDDVLTDHFSVTEGDEDQRNIISLEVMNDAVDLAFVFDDTGSMSQEIHGAKAGVTDLTTAIDAKDVDARYALVTFKDSSVEVDQHFTHSASRLKSKVDDLYASAGGPAPEANFDAIERALDLDWRSDAQRVIVDITDAPSHYKGDGYNTTEYTFDQVSQDIREAQISFISVAPDTENQSDSIKSLTGVVGGLWTDISALRSGIDTNGGTGRFEDVLNRISSLLASTYVLTYESCAPPGERTEVRVAFDHPMFDGGNDTAWLSVPNHYDLPSRCNNSDHPTSKTKGDAMSVDTDTADTPKTPAVERVDDPDTTGVTRHNYAEEEETAKITEEEIVDLAIIPDETSVAVGEEVTFVVRSETGARVEQATISTGGATMTTDSRGQASLTFETTGEYTVEVTKNDGEHDYGTDTVTIKVK